jgi:hypothetical protein
MMLIDPLFFVLRLRCVDVDVVLLAAVTGRLVVVLLVAFVLVLAVEDVAAVVHHF